MNTYTFFHKRQTRREAGTQSLRSRGSRCGIAGLPKGQTMRNFVTALAGAAFGLTGLTMVHAEPGAAGLKFGTHGGAEGVPAGTYACIVYDDGGSRCLVRAISEAELAAARNPERNLGAPIWMRASFEVTNAPVANGAETPVENAFGLPGLMTTDLSADQTALVRCLANSKLALPLEEWNDPAIYQSGIVETCRQETSGGSARDSAALPLAVQSIQEAASIILSAQRLADANALYSNYAGRYATSAPELIAGSLLNALPLATPSMTRSGYVLQRQNRVVVQLKSEAVDVCRALNLMQGRAWATVPASLPVGARSGCYPSEGGFRFVFQG
jgi:hypothetical protein